MLFWTTGEKMALITKVLESFLDFFIFFINFHAKKNKLKEEQLPACVMKRFYMMIKRNLVLQTPSLLHQKEKIKYGIPGMAVIHLPSRPRQEIVLKSAALYFGANLETAI